MTTNGADRCRVCGAIRPNSCRNFEGRKIWPSHAGVSA